MKSDENKYLRTITITGLVQGVGYRPHVWSLAKAHGIYGIAQNKGADLIVKIAGSQDQLDQFTALLTKDHPPLARVDELRFEDSLCDEGYNSFKIIKSEKGDISHTIPPDAATCVDCLSEIKDPNDRRYYYPFTNCTNCGPRLTITKQLPYDRAQTSMAEFKMCRSCQSEYDDPSDRRFHAQPNACPVCGPKIWLCDQTGKVLNQDDNQQIIKQTANYIKQGHILAIKGLGGFHLACDGTNARAIELLRKRKKRPHKPLAIMAKNMEMVADFMEVPSDIDKLMKGRAAPIVLLKKSFKNQLPDGLAPMQNTLGVMLPYTPLHCLLMDELDVPIVLTSANISDEPQIIDNEAALKDLNSIADYFLLHDRDIVCRVDDSLMQIAGVTAVMLRRARGFAPSPLQIKRPKQMQHIILAMGAEQKNSFCILNKVQAICSHHIGDLKNATVARDYISSIERYLKFHEVKPEAIAIDLHEGYFSTQWGQKLAVDLDVPLVPVQHHHAHIAACLAEHKIPTDSTQVLGVIFDGLGLGDDGRLWGGEFLMADYKSYRRLHHIPAIAMVGGEKASRQPWRNLLAHLYAVLPLDQFKEIANDHQQLKGQKLSQFCAFIDKEINSPKASSAGRLFDAVAALLDICPKEMTYEGQAAMQLQALAEQANISKLDLYIPGGQSSTLVKISSWDFLWQGLLKDLNQGKDKAIIAAKFHKTLAHYIYETSQTILMEQKLDTVVLSGGVFQNKLLLSLCLALFEKTGVKVLYPKSYPAGDGGLSLGQAVICAAQLAE